LPPSATLDDADDGEACIKTDTVDIKMDLVSYFTLSSITAVLGLPFGIQ